MSLTLLRICAIFSLAFYLQGCTSYKIKNFETYKVTNLSQNNNSQLRSDNRAKIVISVDDQEIELAKKTNIESFIHGQLEKNFINLKYVTLLDRSVSEKIKNEIIRSEMAGEGYKVMANFSISPDYIILCKLHHVEFSSSYNDNGGKKVGLMAGKIALMAGAAYAMTNNGGSAIMIDASPAPDIRGQYTYTATISGNFKILKVPSFEDIETIPFESKALKKESDSYDSAKEYDKQLLLDAATTAVNSSLIKILQYIKPSAHIIERKDIHPAKPSIFKLSFGSKDGIIEGDEILLKKVIYEYNPISKKEQIAHINYVKLGKATNIAMGSTWVSVKNKALANSLKFGDEVTLAVKKVK